MVIHCINCQKVFYFDDDMRDKSHCPVCLSADVEFIATTIIFAGAANEVDQPDLSSSDPVKDL
jgi:hypothetical protein